MIGLRAQPVATAGGAHLVTRLKIDSSLGMHQPRQSLDTLHHLRMPRKLVKQRCEREPTLSVSLHPSPRAGPAPNPGPSASDLRTSNGPPSGPWSNGDCGASDAPVAGEDENERTSESGNRDECASVDGPGPGEADQAEAEVGAKGEVVEVPGRVARRAAEVARWIRFIWSDVR